MRETKPCVTDKDRDKGIRWEINSLDIAQEIMCCWKTEKELSGIGTS